MDFPRSILWFCCGVQFLGICDHRPVHADLFTQLSSNIFCSIATDIVHHTGPAQLHLMLRPRESVVGVINMPSLLVVVAVTVLMLQ